MVDEHEETVIRLQEKKMDTMEQRVPCLAKSINKIPWILLIAAINLILNLTIIILKH